MKRYAALIFSVGALGLCGAAVAQPAGGPDAKGNAPLKRTHTINDGVAKPGANSFTEGQARQHMLNSGYSSVSGLTKGPDGVWRGTATRGSATVNVALDFKGNVSETGAPQPAAATLAPSPAPAQAASTTTTSTTTTAATTTASVHHQPSLRHRSHHHRRHHHHSAAANVPGRSGVGMSGIDRNHNGVSDKEDRAHDAVVH